MHVCTWASIYSLEAGFPPMDLGNLTCVCTDTSVNQLTDVVGGTTLWNCDSWFLRPIKPSHSHVPQSCINI